MHRRWFDMHMPDSGVNYRNRSDELHGIAISGPRSRELLSRITRDDVSAQGLRFRDIRRTAVGGVPVILARISFSGELGFEIYCAPQYQVKLCEQIEEAGRDLRLKLYGARTLLSLRLEKGWGVWTLDFRPDFTAVESGLDAFVAFDKEADFIGKQAALTQRDKGPEKKLVTMVMETDDIDVTHDEAMFHNGECVGYVTSGGFAHHVQKSVALGYVPTALAKGGEAFEIELLGDMKPAKIVAEPLYDSTGERMRS
jgi:dimethylglycine dehydrogenase